MVAVADRRLRHLRDERLGVAQQQLLHRARAPELLAQVARGEPERLARALHHRAAGGRLTAHEK
jgi:hypothetical protein